MLKKLIGFLCSKTLWISGGIAIGILIGLTMVGVQNTGIFLFIEEGFKHPLITHAIAFATGIVLHYLYINGKIDD